MRFDTWKIAFIAGSLLAAAPGIGSAVEGEEVAGDGWGTEGRRGLLSPLGEYILLGGGVTDFTKSAVRDRFGVGGTWEARLGIGSRFYVGAEVGYVGSTRNGSGAGPDLTTNGIEGVVRVQYPYATGSWLIEPFVFGGLGWSHLSLSRAAAAGLQSTDDVGVVPFGGGVTVGYRHFLLDARFTYRENFNEDLRLAVNDTPQKLSQWSIGASLGYEF